MIRGIFPDFSRVIRAGARDASGKLPLEEEKPCRKKNGSGNDHDVSGNSGGGTTIAQVMRRQSSLRGLGNVIRTRPSRGLSISFFFWERSVTGNTGGVNYDAVRTGTRARWLCKCQPLLSLAGFRLGLLLSSVGIVVLSSCLNDDVVFQ